MSSNPHESVLRSTAAHLTRPGHGLLAADESTGTIGKRLISMGLQNTSETRRQFRQILLLSPNNHLYYSGVILFHETFHQSTDNGVPFPKHLLSRNVLPGIKLDTGLTPYPDHPNETITNGLDNLQTRCREYFQLGARFAKWRATLRIDESNGLPTEDAIQANADTLAEYANIAQSEGLVPIIEPEILIDGDYTVQASSIVAKRVIAQCYASLSKTPIILEATLLKPMMIMPGVSNPDRNRCTPTEIAQQTIDVMREVVPAEVPGIMFLSGGLSEIQATVNLNAINHLAQQLDLPWTLSFSFGRALQTSALKCWQGDPANVQEAMNIASELGRVNGMAQLAKYDGNHPSTQQDATLYEGFRGWRSGEDPKGV